MTEQGLSDLLFVEISPDCHIVSIKDVMQKKRDVRQHVPDAPKFHPIILTL